MVTGQVNDAVAAVLPADLRFDLLLFGQAINLQAYAILAVERMAQGGLSSEPQRMTSSSLPSGAALARRSRGLLP